MSTPERRGGPGPDPSPEVGSLWVAGGDDCGGDDDAFDRFVRAFETAYATRGGADLARFLPDEGHPLRASVLRELVRVDMEFGRERGRPRPLADYLREFPGLGADRQALRAIAFEEYRLRRQSGEDPSPAEYAERYGVRIDPEVGRFRSLAPSSRAAGADGRPVGRGLSVVPRPGPGSAPPSMPEVGDVFLGFRLIGELGRGSFGRVFLARQGELADRPVVLKVTAGGGDEAQTLAQLQHDNIVPVYSRHRLGALRAVCMPYLGSVTLRDVVEDLKLQGSLPESGLGLLSSLGKSSVRGRNGLPPPRAADGDPVPAPASAPSASPAGRANPTRGGSPVSEGPPGLPAGDDRSALGRLSYVEAVAWTGARVADGLAHAHERGILHRDMKPANVLLTDDGRPMLLDFNLAEDLKLRDPDDDGASAVGGTLPYMSPEHLAAFRGGSSRVDARSDLYSTGVILFEMFTGRPPFPVREGVRPEVIRALIADRTGPPPRLRPWNPAVSPALESVVRRCLEPEPASRYASAEELSEDLRRHLARLPLRHAPDPSRRERVGKWFRRHRRASIAVALLAAVVAALGWLSHALAVRTAELARHDAVAALAGFRVDAAEAENRLTNLAEAESPADRRAGSAAARRALDAFHARTDPDGAGAAWWDRPPASRLPAAARAEVVREAGVLLLALARAGFTEGRAAGDRVTRDRLLSEAVRDNRRAEACFPAGRAPAAVWSQRAEFLTRLGDHAGAELAARRAGSADRGDPLDLFLRGSDRLRRGDFKGALADLDAVALAQPANFRARLLAGHCHARLARPARAEACYETCVALWPDHPLGYAHRGLVALNAGDFARAARDFDTALRLRPDDDAFLVGRGLAAAGLGEYGEAARLFTRAIDLGAPQTRVYFMRAHAREHAGDATGAAADRAEGLRREPTDELSWVVRALNRGKAGDHAGALADLDAALALNPASFPALQDKAVIFAERLGRTAEAVAVFDRVLALYPDLVDARGSRAVLLARLGRRGEAVAAAEDALDRDRTPFRRYEAAGVYALTSRQNPVDRAEALRLLSSALSRSPKLARTARTDPDLDPIRTDPEFRRILARAEADLPGRAGAGE